MGKLGRRYEGQWAELNARPDKAGVLASASTVSLKLLAAGISGEGGSALEEMGEDFIRGFGVGVVAAAIPGMQAKIEEKFPGITEDASAVAMTILYANAITVAGMGPGKAKEILEGGD